MFDSPVTFLRSAESPDFFQTTESRSHLRATDQEKLDISIIFQSNRISSSRDQFKRTSRRTLFFPHRRRRQRFTLYTRRSMSDHNQPVDHLRSIWNVAIGRDTVRPFRTTRRERRK